MSDIPVKCSFSKMELLEKLIPNPRNDNRHQPKHAEALAKIMRARGIRHPIIVSKRSGFIIAGHLRLEAARVLGLEEYPIDLQDFENDADEYAFLSADNNISRYAEFDKDKFLDNLKELEIDLESFDFEEVGLIDFQLPEIVEDDDPGKDAKENPFCQKVTLILSNEQKDIFDAAIEKAIKEEDCEDELNDNKNGNAISAILKRFIYG
jgi:hypothetical protein